MNQIEAKADSLDSLFKKRVSKNLEEMTSYDWSALIIDFFEFCKPFMLVYKDKWTEMAQPDPDIRYQPFRHMGQSDWGQGTLEYLVCKQAAAYIIDQNPQLAEDVKYKLADNLNWETAGRLILSSSSFEEKDPRDGIYPSLRRKRFIVVAEGGHLLVCELLAQDVDPWAVGWQVKECEISSASIENLEELLEQQVFIPHELLRAIFEFTKEIILAEQTRIMEEKTKEFTGLFSSAVMSTFM